MKIEGKEECTLACYPVIFLNIHSLTNYKHHISVKIENLLLNFLNNIILLLERPLPLCITEKKRNDAKIFLKWSLLKILFYLMLLFDFNTSLVAPTP